MKVAAQMSLTPRNACKRSTTGKWPVEQAVFDCLFQACCSFPALRLCEDQLLQDSLLTAE